MDEEYIEPTGEILEAAAPESEVNEVTHDQSVPLSALQSERAHRQQIQQELDMIRNHLALMQSNQQSQMVDDDGDIITKGDLKKMLKEKESEFNNRIAEIQVSKKYPDYDEVVTKYLPEAIKENPKIRDVLLSTNDYEMAYYLAKKSDAYQKASKKTKKNEDAERILKNSSSSGSLAGFGSNSPISTAKPYKNMSDEEFRALMNKNMGQY